jgi:hypothetical protein
MGRLHPATDGCSVNPRRYRRRQAEQPIGRIASALVLLRRHVLADAAHGDDRRPTGLALHELCHLLLLALAPHHVLQSRRVTMVDFGGRVV